jgi:signal transduction histidine kinase
VISIITATVAVGRQWRQQAAFTQAQEETRRVRFLDTMENFGNPVSIYGPDHHLVVANHAYKELHLGTDGLTIIRDGMSFADVEKWRSIEGFWRLPPENVITLVGGPSGSSAYELADGRSMLVEHRQTSDGSSVGTWTDVTSIRAAEAERRELEAQLHHALKQDALGQLASGIAHDLNNALVPVLVMTEMAMEAQAVGSPERANLALAVQGARRSKELVQRILIFTRKEIAEKQELDFADVVHEAMTMLRAGLPSTIDLVVDIGSVSPIFGDPGQLYQVVINLVTNAAHAIGPDIGAISVRLHEDASGSPIILTVSDTGCGMDEETRAKIFDPFFTTKSVNEGTGLGLSMVYGTIVAHGGTIAVKSERGEGSTFTIVLPVLNEKPDHDAVLVS